MESIRPCWWMSSRLSIQGDREPPCLFTISCCHPGRVNIYSGGSHPWRFAWGKYHRQEGQRKMKERQKEEKRAAGPQSSRVGSGGQGSQTPGAWSPWANCSAGWGHVTWACVLSHTLHSAVLLLFHTQHCQLDTQVETLSGFQTGRLKCTFPRRLL